MDRSDEPIQNNVACFTTPAAFECDEYVDSRSLWSCGDGEHIFPWARFPFQRLTTISADCSNFRNLNYICETSRYVAAWTLPNGKCEFDRNYDDPRFDGTTANISSTEMCIYLLKCGLTNGFERDCPCGRNTSCYNLMMSYCPNPQWIQFPNMGLIRPYVLTYYMAQESYPDKTPAYFVFSGTIQCRGYRAVASSSMNITIFSNYLSLFILSSTKDFFFCSNTFIQKNTSSPISYFPANCWNDSRTFSNHSYHHIDICLNFQQCISAYRINDGNIDCAGPGDEMRFYSKQPFSDFCNISSEYPCLLANVTNPLDIKRNRPCIDMTLIGDGIYHCHGGLDERNTATGCT
ncbi:unnamed protein product, partial [Adineta steineri]